MPEWLRPAAEGCLGGAAAHSDSPMRTLLLLLALVLSPTALRAQLLADTLFTWQGYGKASECRVRLYLAHGRDERTHVAVLEEVASNRGASTLDDARHLAELVGRRFGLDPADAHWIFHWGAFSFEGAVGGRRKELFLRATFRRTPGGALAAPSWRLLTRSEVEAFTDRLFR